MGRVDMDMEHTVVKPSNGQSDWGTALNAHLDTLQSTAALPSDVAALVADDSNPVATGLSAKIVTWVTTVGSAVQTALATMFVPQFNGTGKTAAQINTWLADGGKYKRLTGTISVAAPLVLDNTDVYFDLSGSTLNTNGDYAAITSTTGQAINLRNVKIVNAYAGARTTWDIDILNPTKTMLHNVEVNLPNASTGKGGIRIRYDAGTAGNKFMPQLDKVWIRNGHLIVDGVTDGHLHDSFVWAPSTGARAAIEFLNAANGWAITSTDYVPPINGGIGIYFEGINHTRISGGYADGNDAGLQTGYGIWAKDCGRLTIANHGLWNVGRSGLVLEGSSFVKVIGCDFSKNNKQDNFYPDIDLIDSDYNTFLGNAHWAPDARTNKGVIYREDSSSAYNRFDHNAFSPSSDYYARPVVSANEGTMGRNNRPEGLFPRVSGAPDLIAPPACLVAVGAAAAWPAANSALLHRFTVSVGGFYRYVNFRVDAGSGNMQASVLKLSGATFSDYTRVMTSGVVACTTGDKTLDLGAVYLDPGEYALALWFDNTTVTARYATNSGMTASRLTAEVAGLAVTGVGASGTGISWGSTRYVGGVSLGYTV